MTILGHGSKRHQAESLPVHPRPCGFQKPTGGSAGDDGCARHFHTRPIVSTGAISLDHANKATTHELFRLNGPGRVPVFEFETRDAVPATAA